jgi:orotate phosphoribosyltransferase
LNHAYSLFQIKSVDAEQRVIEGFASTPELEADRQYLIALIEDEAVFHGDFTLSSGKQATYYVDMRKLTLDHRAAPAIGRIMLDLIRDVDGIVAVGGLTGETSSQISLTLHHS